jgi:hypothetical protein
VAGKERYTFRGKRYAEAHWPIFRNVEVFMELEYGRKQLSYLER